MGEWLALTSTLNVRDLIYNNNALYCTTEGGLSQLQDETIFTYTTIDGLLSVDLGPIDIDSNGHIWIGGFTPFGFIQIFDPIKKEIVETFDFELTAILDIQISDLRAFALFQDGQDFGIMKFMNDNGWGYRDSFRNFPENAGVISSFYANDSSIFIGSESGLYKGNLSDNLKDPKNWALLDSTFTENITSIIGNDSELVFSSPSNIFSYNFELKTINQIEFSNTLSDISKIIFDGNDLIILAGENLYLKSNGIDTQLLSAYSMSNMTVDGNSIIVGSDHGLLIIDESYSVDRFLPNMPMTGGFTAISVLDDGRLVGGNRNGLSIYSDEGWRNIFEKKDYGTDTIYTTYDYSSFIGDTIPYSFGGFIADIEEGPDGLIYCSIRGSYPQSTWGPSRRSGGVIVLDIDDPSQVAVIDTAYLSYFSTASNSRPYMVVLDLEFDNSGNLWVANPYCINKNNPIHVRSLQNEWKHYGSSETSTKISQSPCSIAIDPWDRVWVSAFQAEEANFGIYPNGGIAMLDYDGGPTNPDAFSWTRVQNDGTVWSLGMGKNDRLYYLTPSGLNYFDIKDSGNPIVRENTLTYFPNISFGIGAKIKIDHHGNVWAFSPTAGIHVLLENTTYWPDINGIRADNSPLLSDEITDIAFDEKRNLAYIATSKGVNVLRIPFGEKKKTYSNVKVFPSPFYIPSDIPMTVDGLLYESSMMVMTLDGKVVKHITSQGISVDGDQLSWNGRDKDGDYVSSGVYLLAIYGQDGSQKVEKITVIRN